MKVLVADDNAQNRYLLEQVLTANGHQCVGVSNGSEALAMIKSEPFDAVISDILMPVMDGFQLCREIKKDSSLAATPFIFYTATYTEPGDAELGLRLGAARYLMKPTEPSVIIAALRDITPAQSPPELPQNEEVFLAQYNSRLIRKLESKTLELERANIGLLRTNLALSDEISRRRTAEKTAQAALALQRAALESTADGVLAVDADGKILTWNTRFVEIWRLQTEGIEQVRTFERLLTWLCNQSSNPEEAKAEWKARATITDRSTFDVVVLSDGRTVERLSYPLQAPDGRLGLVWTFRDVTARHRIEEANRSLQGQLFEMQKMEALGVLAGGIAHDFNNILTAIMGQASMAAEELPPEHPVQESLAVVTKASARAAQLVKQILTFSRHQEPVRRCVKAETVIDEALKLMRSTLPAGITIETDFGSDIPLIKVDATQVHQVLINLGTNASYVMNGKGRIFVKLRAVRAPAEGPAELAPGLYAMLSVRDSGPGIAPEIARRIFEPFYTTKPPGEGTGLGLAVVHGIVSSHGGYIILNGNPGKGAEFQIYLPMASEVGDGLLVSPADLLRRGHGERVLVAEDDPAVQATIVNLLARLGYVTEAFSSAEDALRNFEKAPGNYAVLLTDLSMRGMSGTDLARRARNIRPAIPVIIMTGYFSTEALEKERSSLQFDLLLKPCSAVTVSNALYRVLTQ